MPEATKVEIGLGIGQVVSARLDDGALKDLRKAVERILEVGPGTGYYTLDLAEWVESAGRVDIFDLQREMLDHTLRRARERGLVNVHDAQGDAQSLPYEDESFDAALLVATLGEIPDQDAALREVARVLRPGGRLVVGELFGDPHMVTVGSLERRAGGG